MKKKYLLLGLILLVGMSLGYSLSFLNAFPALVDYLPFSKLSEFARACSELNSQELTSRNIEKLGGWCFVRGGLAKCEEENIKRLNNGTDPFFNIYQARQYENTWICGIGKTEDGKIKAWTYYQYD